MIQSRTSPSDDAHHSLSLEIPNAGGLVASSSYNYAIADITRKNGIASSSSKRST